MKELIKQGLNRLGLAAVTTRHSGLRYLQHQPSTMFESVLLRVYPKLTGLRFIQIGANDGIRGDPLKPFVEPYHWSGIRIEPLPYNFAALQANCGSNKKVTLIQAAVDVNRERRLVYDLNPNLKNLPDWTRGLASFSLSRLQQVTRELGLSEDVIEHVEVDTITWSDVWTEFGPSRCDLLILDTEGYEIALLKACELAKHKPRIVHFEHACVAFEERMAFYGDLLKLGYEVASEDGDTTAWLPI